MYEKDLALNNKHMTSNQTTLLPEHVIGEKVIKYPWLYQFVSMFVWIFFNSVF